MAKSNIQNITTAQSFQNWFDKTNEMVDLFRTSAVTASVAGDITTGDVNLVGDLTVTNLLADTQIKTDSIVSYTGGATVVLGSPLQVTSSASEIAATFQYGASGALTRYTNGTSSWDIGIEDNTNLNFIINTGVGATRFELSAAGTLKVPNLETIESIVATEDVSIGRDLTVTGNTVFGGTLTADDLTLSGDLTCVDVYAQDVFATGEVTTAYSASDRKLKENINVIDNALDKVSQVNGYTFNYIGKEEIATGVIAQEIEKVLPGVVYETHSEENGNFKAVRYGNIVGLLIEAIKELKDEVDNLKNGSTD